MYIIDEKITVFLFFQEQYVIGTP